MQTLSIRKKVNETIIIQNSKRAFKYSLTTIIGMCCPFNLLGISSIDITYKFSLIWMFLVLLFAVRPALKRRGIKVFLRVNNQKSLHSSSHSSHLCDWNVISFNKMDKVVCFQENSLILCHNFDRIKY